MLSFLLSAISVMFSTLSSALFLETKGVSVSSFNYFSVSLLLMMISNPGLFSISSLSSNFSCSHWQICLKKAK